MTETGATQVMRYSVILPVYNEAEVIKLTLAELKEAMSSLNGSYEVLLVDDGSKDSTVGIAKEFATEHGWGELRVIELQRNFGHMAALSAGLDQAKGNWVGMLDGDLQHPPKVLMEMFLKAEESKADVVQGVRTDSAGVGISKGLLSRVFYWFARKSSGIEVIPDAADFRVVSKSVVDELNGLPEEDKVYRLLLPWLGYQTVLIPFAAPKRAAGKPSYTGLRSARLGVSGLVGFTTAPLQFVTIAGLLVGVLAIVWLGYVLWAFFSGQALQGWTSILAAVLILGSVQLIGIGFLGEYLARAYRRLQGRPAYVLKK
jgi:dolichol-phosphate mannosyltransferase